MVCGYGSDSLRHSHPLIHIMPGLPWGRPGLPEILRMAKDAADLQPYRSPLGEFEQDPVPLAVKPGSNRQQRQDPRALAAAKAVIGYAGDRSKGDAAQGALITGLAARRARGSLPAEPVGNHQERMILWNESEVADGNQRVLQTGRDHREVVRILGAQLERGTALVSGHR